MSKKLVVAMALSLVLAGGFFFTAQAGCDFGFNACMPPTSLPSCHFCAPQKDMDRDTMTKQVIPLTSEEQLRYDTYDK